MLKIGSGSQLECASAFQGACWVPPRASNSVGLGEAWKFAFLTGLLVMSLLLVPGPYFVNHDSKEGVLLTLGLIPSVSLLHIYLGGII